MKKNPLVVNIFIDTNFIKSHHHDALLDNVLRVGRYDADDGVPRFVRAARGNLVDDGVSPQRHLLGGLRHRGQAEGQLPLDRGRLGAVARGRVAREEDGTDRRRAEAVLSRSDFCRVCCLR